MLESVGPLGYVIRRLNQVRKSGDTSQSRLEVIEIIEALILALVLLITAIGQRFRFKSVRVVFMILAFLLLCLPLLRLLMLPRI